MSMLFLRKNELNTTTMVVVDAVNTSTVTYAFDRKPATQWSTVGYQTTTSTIFSVEFPTATVIDKIFLKGHNLKQFRVFYNSATANTFSTPINETTNSATANYFTFNTVTVSSVQVQVDRATTTDTEKKIGELYVGSLLLSMERNPPTANYTPEIERKHVIHRMPDGGVSQFITSNRFRTTLRWRHLTDGFVTSLRNIYDTSTSFVFTPFPTTSSWDGDAFEVLWTNDFDFRHSANNFDAGKGGQIVLEERA